jgi:hypothetical protein
LKKAGLPILRKGADRLMIKNATAGRRYLESVDLTKKLFELFTYRHGRLYLSSISRPTILTP